MNAEPKTKSSARAKKAVERMSQSKKKSLHVELEMRREPELKQTSKKFVTFDNSSTFAVFSQRNLCS